MKNTQSKIGNSLGLIQRGLYKTFIGSAIYGKKDDYDAQKYWSDRFSKYGHSLKGVGNEGLSEQENEKAYAEAAKIFIDVCQKQDQDIDFPNARVLEIGCGTGFYTQILSDLGVKNYLGVDITDVLFPELKQKFPHFHFIRKDITVDKIAKSFDLIVMIDVIEHIVNGSKFTFAMNNVKSCLDKQGVFIVAPILEASKRELFYVRSWSIEDINNNFQNYNIGELVPFRTGYISTIRKGNK
jgi:2-polyprenyl-3-methyl-5-hydroxy-6-metoxy-1,4-benzoquinol methylase